MTLDELHARVDAYLTDHHPALSGRPLGPLVELTGGWASSLYALTPAGSGSGDVPVPTWVLKLYAPDEAGREHAVREWAVLSHLRAADQRVPAVRAFEPDAGPLGRPFLVMDHIAGQSLWSAFEAGDTVERTRLTQAFTQRLVALHALDPHGLDPHGLDPVGLDPSVPTGHRYAFIDAELAGVRRDSEPFAHTGVMDVVRWLEQRRDAVPCEGPVILHRDYHPWNVLVDAAGLLWVIDWDWRIGDARFDLAWTCTLMQRSRHDAFSDAVRQEYARRSERPLAAFAVFEVLATLRWLLNVLPAVGPHSQLGRAARAEFRAFLVDPVRAAQALLRSRTGVPVAVPV